MRVTRGATGAFRMHGVRENELTLAIDDAIVMGHDAPPLGCVFPPSVRERSVIQVCCEKPGMR